VLEIARALREQIDWERLRHRVDESPFGAAFFTLAERLRILPDSRETDDRVVPFPPRRARASGDVSGSASVGRPPELRRER
jgi:hypothetical protein